MWLADPGSISFLDIRGRSDPVSSDSSLRAVLCRQRGQSSVEPFLDDGRGCQVNSDELQVLQPLTALPGKWHR